MRRTITTALQILALAVLVGCAFAWDVLAGVFVLAGVVLVGAVLLEPDGAE